MSRTSRVRRSFNLKFPPRWSKISLGRQGRRDGLVDRVSVYGVILSINSRARSRRSLVLSATGMWERSAERGTYCARSRRPPRGACGSCGPSFGLAFSSAAAERRSGATGSRGLSSLILVGKKQLLPCLAHVPLHIVGEPAKENCAHMRFSSPMVDGADLGISSEAKLRRRMARSTASTSPCGLEATISRRSFAETTLSPRKLRRTR
jgi:hypothetical protein